ncbi:MAG: ABC transporter permease [Acidisphaera sp.]|nr:ABC transporter permease [Acidisphaera sp.]
MTAALQPGNVAEAHASHAAATPFQASHDEAVMEFVAGLPLAGRHRLAVDDLREGLRLRRLFATLGWLDIKMRYRGSMLGPFWLTLSTAVMVGALGVLYSTLFRMNLHEYLPFLALSLVLWNFLSALVGDSCICFTAAEGMIRSIRMPYFLYAGQVIVRNFLVLAHNVVVIVVVYLIFSIWPGLRAVLAVPALLLWVVDAFAVAILLGTFCARFRDIPPIVGSIMQIAFFVSPIIWKPELIQHHARWLPLNPFFSLLEIVRGPLLGEFPSWEIWAASLFYSALLCGTAWALFVRVRGRLAFWV